MPRHSNQSFSKILEWGERLGSRRCSRSPLLALLASLVSLFQAHAQTVHHVSIDGMQFKPSQIRAAVGDTVVWRNDDLVPHTVTATDKSFDSGPIEVKGTWSLLVVRPGEIPYTCTIHPQMTGKITAWMPLP